MYRVIGICKDKGEKKKRITGLEVTEMDFKNMVLFLEIGLKLMDLSFQKTKVEVKNSQLKLEIKDLTLF